MHKRRLKEVLYGFEVRITGIIANGLVHRTPKAVIFRLMKQELARTASYLKLDEREIQNMWVDCTFLYGKISKETFGSLRRSERSGDYKEKLVERKDIVYKSVRKYLSDLEKNKNNVANSVEYRVKFAEKQEILNSDNIFYICNWFEDCAKDHIPYQGRIYVNDDWKNLGFDEDQARIEAYIKNHNILTVGEVMNNAPWLVTRRNCRHKLFPITVEEVLGSSVNSILKRHDLRRKHENEYNCVLTPQKVSYIGYYERLKALLYLKSMFDCEKLNEDIKETRHMMDKWHRAVKEA